MRCNSYPKCGVCGAPGHVDRACALWNLNAAQERRERVRQHNMRLGLTPDLERQIEAIRASWRIGILGVMREA